jgi:hypothetical protein
VPIWWGSATMSAFGRVVEALDAFLRRHQGADACRNRVQWLGGARERR